MQYILVLCSWWRYESGDKLLTFRGILVAFSDNFENQWLIFIQKEYFTKNRENISYNERGGLINLTIHHIGA